MTRCYDTVSVQGVGHDVAPGRTAMVTANEKKILDAVAAALVAYDALPRNDVTCAAFANVLGHMLTPIRKGNYPLYQKAVNRLIARLSYAANNALLAVEYSDKPGPRFVHDCDKCKYLGKTEQDGFRYDLYACEGKELAYVARYGNEGEEYRSVSDDNAAKHFDPLWAEAMSLYEVH